MEGAGVASVRSGLRRLYEIRNDDGSPLLALEGLRGFSVLLVFCVHVFGWLLAARTGGSPDASSLRDFNGLNLLLAWLFLSHHGVHVFFVLSGFLIGRLLQRPDFRPREFIQSRLRRIFPAFALSLMVAIGFRVIVIGDMTVSLPGVVENLLLLNGIPGLGVAAYNPITWSLFNEVVFYALVAFICGMFGTGITRHWWQLITFALATVFLPLLIGYVDARFMLFFFGLWIAGRDARQLRDLAHAVPTHYVVGFYVFAATSWPARFVEYGTSIFLFGAATVVLIVKCCYDEGPLRRIATWAPLRYLGNISYSFYLVHAIAIGWLAHAWSPTANSVRTGSIVVFAITAFAISWIAATFLFLIAERAYFKKPGVRRWSTSIRVGASESGPGAWLTDVSRLSERES